MWTWSLFFPKWTKPKLDVFMSIYQTVLKKEMKYRKYVFLQGWKDLWLRKMLNLNHVKRKLQTELSKLWKMQAFPISNWIYVILLKLHAYLHTRGTVYSTCVPSTHAHAHHCMYVSGYLYSTFQNGFIALHVWPSTGNITTVDYLLIENTSWCVWACACACLIYSYMHNYV